MCEKRHNIDCVLNHTITKKCIARKDLLKGLKSTQVNQECVLQRAHRKNPNEVTHEAKGCDGGEKINRFKRSK